MWTLFALMMFVIGLIGAVYSPWLQEMVREKLVEKINQDPHTDFALEKLRLTFPLRLELKGVMMATDGDTLIQARGVEAQMSVLGLLKGDLAVDKALLTDARYKIGSRDSATCIILQAARAQIAPAIVRLSPSLDIDVSDGLLSDAMVDIFINPIDTTPAKPYEPASPMNIHVAHLDMDNLTYRMNMLPTIDSLSTNIHHASLDEAKIDIQKQTIDIQRFGGNGLNVAYVAADAATADSVAALIKKYPKPDAGDVKPTPPWTINLQALNFTDSRALYTTRGYKAENGFDAGYIAVDSMKLDVTGFYNQAEKVNFDVAVSGVERSGVALSALGRLAIDADGISFENFDVTTPRGTAIGFDGFMSNDVPQKLKVAATADVARDDLTAMFPFVSTYTAPLADDTLVHAEVDANGTMDDLSIEKLSLDIAKVLTLNGSGRVKSMTEPTKLAGHVKLAGEIGNVRPWQKMLLAGTGIGIPPMSMRADVDFGSDRYAGSFNAKTRGGKLALDGSFNGRGESYDINLTTNKFPVNAFISTPSIKNLTATVRAKGHGFDVMKASTACDATFDLKNVEYEGVTYSDISGTLNLADGVALADIVSTNPALDLTMTAQGNLDGDTYDWDVTLDGKRIDLESLKFSDEQAVLSMNMTCSGQYTPGDNTLAMSVRLNNFDYTHYPMSTMTVEDVTAFVNATDSVTNLSVRNRDLYAYFSSPTSIDSLMTKFAGVSNVLGKQIGRRRLDIVELQEAIPRFNLDINAGENNLLTQILDDSDMGFKTLTITAANDTALMLDAHAEGFHSGTTLIDDLKFKVRQNGNRLDYIGKIDNRPGTFDDWAKVDINGFFEPGTLGLNLVQQNIKGSTGFDIGAKVTFNPDSTATIHLDPLMPTIGYQKWTVNEDNFIKYSFKHRHLDANLRMNSNESSLAIYTEHAQETEGAAHGADEDLIVQLSDIKVQDWVSLNPFAPPIKGLLSADMRINWEGNAITGKGTASIKNLIYGKEKVGDIATDIDLLTNTSGLINADVALWVDGVKTATLKGVLNDSTRTSPFNLDFSMIHFPLKTLNPFLPGVAKLTGTLNGQMDVSGDSDNPRLNGSIDFDSATVKVDMLGSTFKISDEKIPVIDNLVTFTNFGIHGLNDKFLSVNGTVDAKSKESPVIDLAFKANNLQIVNSNRAAKGADVYGKAFINLDATVKGNMDIMRVNANLGVQPGTNVTYIMPDAVSTLESQTSNDMVRFVNFNDSTYYNRTDSLSAAGMLLFVDAVLNIQNGSTINVDLSTDGKNKASLQSQGTLNFTMNPSNSGRLTGRLNINGGYARYGMAPLMSEMTFNFQPDSYVAFNGDMMNPTLNVLAIDNMRANVTQEGQNSRLIYFDVSLSVTGTLSNMDVSFDLSTDDDMTIANELAAMSQSQRANQAMNMLLYKVYTGPGTKASANLSGNPLYSFLSSQINSWAAGAIKGVDLSFGIDKYDTTSNGSTSSTMSYSYRVSKTLFNDRFKIVVGGNYSTDTNAEDNLSQNLINDISLEYYLNNSRSMYVKIFRHTGYESILEGEITQTGVGFVYKRKIRRLLDMIIPRRRRRTTTATAAATAGNTDEKQTQQKDEQTKP